MKNEQKERPFKKGDKVRINAPEHVTKHGKKAVITALLTNGALLRFSSGMGTVVRFEHLEHV